MALLLNGVLLISAHENSHCRIFLFKGTVDFQFCVIYKNFLTPIFVVFTGCLMLYFRERIFQRKYFCIFSNCLTSWKGILVKRARHTILDIANVLNTTILPSNVKFLIFLKFRTP